MEHRPTITPYLTVNDGTAAIEFYKTVFGAQVVDKEFYEQDGRVAHCTLQIGTAELFVSDEYPELGAVAPTTAGASTAAVVISVPDTDATHAAALAAGATESRPPSQQMGFRSSWFVDPFGHRWSLTGPEKADE